MTALVTMGLGMTGPATAEVVTSVAAVMLGGMAAAGPAAALEPVRHPTAVDSAATETAVDDRPVDDRRRDRRREAPPGVRTVPGDRSAVGVTVPRAPGTAVRARTGSSGAHGSRARASGDLPRGTRRHGARQVRVVGFDVTARAGPTGRRPAAARVSTGVPRRPGRGPGKAVRPAMPGPPTAPGTTVVTGLIAPPDLITPPDPIVVTGPIAAPGPIAVTAVGVARPAGARPHGPTRGRRTVSSPRPARTG